MLLTGVLLIIGAAILIIYRGKSIDIYIGSIGDTDINGVDIQLKINNKMVWENNIHSGLNNYAKLHHNLKFGYNAIEVLSKNKNLLIKKNVFVLTNQHIVIEYIPAQNSSKHSEGLGIEIRNGEFRYE